MNSEILLSPDYKPSKDEEYMCEMHLEYFRQKLLSWKKSLIGQSKDTLDDYSSATNWTNVASKIVEKEV
jgi:DnaK suppressor protein